MFTIVVHSLNPGLVLDRGYYRINRIPAPRPALPPHDRPAFAAGHHMAHVGTTVTVSQEGPIEISPCTAKTLPAAGKTRRLKKKPAPCGRGLAPGNESGARRKLVSAGEALVDIKSLGRGK